MKKYLILPLIMASLSLAGAKEDLEKAYNDYQKNQNLETLTKDLTKISKLPLDDYVLQANLDLANLDLSNNKIDDAKKKLSDLLKLKNITKEQKTTVYLNLISLVDMKSNDFTKYIEELIKLDPSNEQYKLNQLLNYSLKNDKKEDSLYNTLVSKKIDKEKLNILVLLANDLLEGKYFDNAKKYIEKIKSLKDDDASFYYNLMLAYFEADKNKDLDKAIEYATEAEKLAPNNVENLALLTELFESKNNINKALEKVNILNALYDDKNPDIIKKIGLYKLRLGLQPEAERYLLQADRMFNYSDLETANLLLNLYSQNELLNDAEIYAKRLDLLTNSTNPDAILVLAQLYSINQNKDKALEYYLKYKELTKTPTSYILAILQAEINENNNKVDELLKEMNTNFKNEASKINYSISDTALNMSLYELAIKYAEKALNNDKSNEANLTLAFAYYFKNDKNNAKKYFDNAVNLKLIEEKTAKELLDNLK